ncbi:MAG: cysteine--tRNA ligase [Oscillospiraceae bacterium]|nr:cysteine--tRNA ligase [Oscillospiraceae bacterium]
MKLYNTMSRSKEEFLPVEPGRVKMYACGPTVYDFFHIGNARAFINFDTMRRYLEYIGFEVEFCQNFTDIDDKIIRRAREEDTTIDDISERYIKEYYIDADRLKILRPTHQPKATETVPEMIGLISELMEKGIAYELPDGVYYDVSKFTEYGKLSRYHLDDLVEGAGERENVREAEGKRNPGDFVLWKKKKENEPAWPSPWGEGRPGWHIECSAMIRKHLGDTIDIHGGGQDLIFPHHENEIAQSEALTGAPLSKYWVHNAFVNIDNEKMSKSAGNFFTIRDIIKKFEYRVIRFFILTGHYRMPINFADSLLEAAENGLDRIRESVVNLRFTGAAEDRKRTQKDERSSWELMEAIEKASRDFLDAMEDDFNTADAITAIFQLVRTANTACQNPSVSSDALLSAADKIMELGEVLGLDILGEDEDGIRVPDEVTHLVKKRTIAKQERDFALADQLRDRVTALGYQIKDTPSGPQVIKL